MPTNFKIGDKVVRTSSPKNVYDGGKVVVGGLYEVKDVRQNGLVIEVIGSDYTYNSEYFRLAKEQDNPWLSATGFPEECDVGLAVNKATAKAGNTYMNFTVEGLDIQLPKGAVITGISFENEENKLDKKPDAKFKAGDKVMALTDHIYFVDIHKPLERGVCLKGWKKGEVFTVTDASGIIVVLEGEGNQAFRHHLFELVEEPPTFKAMKFRINSPEQSKEIQEALFSMGYGWELYGKQLKSFKYFYGNPWLEKWLHTDEDGILYRSDEDPDCDVTPSSPFYHQEYTIKTTKSYELIPVVPEVTVETTPEELVELMGQKYSKKELEDALRSLKPVV